ncbi:uncharacterized protein LOC128273159 [Anopheles cruzii]|uniref:uncharacterized protein LOC128273159 n=1 Tax=Anopheles cruzii TaxID=68878 RepID=UPI0022EC35B7|nr:uncharacterized protein LOC128273159 [Anopheles cruzii]
MSNLSSNVCFDALSVLNNVHLVENVCSICGASHYTQNCPENAKGDHVKDKPTLNLSRSSVPNGLLIMDTPEGGSCVVTSQKFAKGTRFGPLLAQRSYVPVKSIPFPLVLFAPPYYHEGEDDEYSAELQTLFSSGRNVYLDTRNETKCNWMIHVSLARFSNEQNLICYQENDEIYYSAVKDIELGDILRVWYSRSYAAKIGVSLLEPSPYDICNNILRSVSMDYGFALEKASSNGCAADEYNRSPPMNVTTIAGGLCADSCSALSCGTGRDRTPNAIAESIMIPPAFDDTFSSMPHSVGSGSELADIDNNNNSSNFCSATSDLLATGQRCSGGSPASTSGYDKVSLPPIDSLMKTTSPKYSNTPLHHQQNHMFDLELLGTGAALTAASSSNVADLMDVYFNHSSAVTHSSQHVGQPQHHPLNHHHQEQQHLASFSQHSQNHNDHHHLQQQQQQHLGMISMAPEDDLRLARQLSSHLEQQSPISHMHHHHHQHHPQMVGSSANLLDYAPCLPDDTLSPADLINISLGASDINIAFESFDEATIGGMGDNANGHMMSYDAAGDEPDGVAFCDSSFTLMAATGTNCSDSGGDGGGLEKLHSRFSSSSDSLITLNDAGSVGGVTAVTPTPSLVPSTPGGSVAADTDTEKKHVCEVCLRKYMTKSNLDKHVRKHNLFLCVFCMKLFQQADELKEHECSERRTKTAYLHCPKCLKVLSNSWSLQRHMKIHKELIHDEPSMVTLAIAGGTIEERSNAVIESPAYEDISITSTATEEDVKPTIEHRLEDRVDGVNTMKLIASSEIKQEIFDPEPVPPQQQQSLVGKMSIKSEPGVRRAGSSPGSPLTPVVSALPNATTGTAATNTSSSQDMITNVQAPNGKQLYKCIVCSKLFKNPNALEKHLRKVHTVYTVSNDYKSEKKVMSQLNQKKTSPIKPAIAKALATKLSQKSKKQEELNAAAAAAAAAATAAAAAAGGASGAPSSVTEPQSQLGNDSNSRTVAQDSLQQNKTVQQTLKESTHASRSQNPKKKHATANGSELGSNNCPGSATTLATTEGNQRQHPNLGSRDRRELQIASNAKDLTTGCITPASSVAATSAAAKSHSIIIISNLELTNNNLIDTSHLFHGATGTGSGPSNSALGNKLDVKVLNSSDKLPKLVPISNHHHHPPTVVSMGGPAGTLQLPAGAIMVPTTGTVTMGNMMNSNVQAGSGQGSGAASAVPTESVFVSSGGNATVDVEGCSLVVEDISSAGAGSVGSVPTLHESQLLTLSSIKLSDSNDPANDHDCASMIAESDHAQLSQTFPCDECDRVFAKNYQLKRHLEIHDSVYYTCPYCDRGPLKAKASLRKHLYNVHPERAPPKEQINKFISTLVVTDENVLRELAIKNERKIRNKSAKQQAKQLQQQLLQQRQKQDQQQQDHHQKLDTLCNSSTSANFLATANVAATGNVIMYENGFPRSALIGEEGEDMLSFKTIFPSEGSIGESSIDPMDHTSLENCDQSSTCSSSTNYVSLAGGSTVVQEEDKKRKASNNQARLAQSHYLSSARSAHACSGRSNSIDGGIIVSEGKRMRIVNPSVPSSAMIRSNDTGTMDVSGSRENAQQRYGSCSSSSSSNVAGTPVTNGTGALRYLRKIHSVPAPPPTSELTGASSSSVSLMPFNGGNHSHNQSSHGVGVPLVDGGVGSSSSAPQLNLDSLFGNISIDNYEFDDNATIQSFSLIEEKFKTSFDQIQEKLDAELPFDEEQIKWQNNLMANDSSSEIGDKMLTGEENIMLI